MPSTRGFDVTRSVTSPQPGAVRSAASGRLREQALALVRSERLVAAAYSYRIAPLERPAGPSLHVAGEVLEAPWLLPSCGELTAIAFGVATLGPALEERVHALFGEGRAALAVTLDDLGNELLFAASRRLQDRMLADVTKQGLTMAGELRSGDPGLAIETQPLVLRLADGEAVGVRISSGCMMYPVKSTSMVLGVGRDLPEVKWSRCDQCPSLERCRVAQRSRGTVT